ncbi:MAG: FAD-binding and (Fe-S)-binding domain-containing protein [Phycisphaerales bacterium]
MPPLPILPAGLDRPEIARRLAGAVEGEVRFGLHDRMLYATDASLYQVEPIGVVIPSSIPDAVRAIEFCTRSRLPILPRGGGTSLAGQCTNRAVVLDFSARCRVIVGVDAASRTCRVEPGITIDDLNADLAARGTGLFFAPDPATSRHANIGGCIGNNAAGARSIRYGRTSENVLAIDAAVAVKSLADAAGGPPEAGVRLVRFEVGAGLGDDPLVRTITRRVAEVVTRHERLIRERFPKTIRRNAGYGLDLVLAQIDAAGPRADSDAVLRAINLAPFLCGSEGTLAVTLGADLRLHPIPAARGLSLIALDSLDAAIELVAPLLASGPTAVELIDDTILGLAAANAEYRRYVEAMPMPAAGSRIAVLYVEHSAERSADELTDRAAQLREIVERHAPRASLRAMVPPANAAAAWKLRKAGEPLLHGMPGERKPLTFVEDNAVPVENLPRFVREFRAIVERHGTRAAFWAHASVGVLHVRPFLSLRDPDDRERLREIATEVADLARSLGGVMSGEHGDGRVRGPLLERFFGPELLAAFREIKAIFDPLNLLNPGMVVEPGPIVSITDNLRALPRGELLGTPNIETYFDYEDQHGFRGAVEMCNGAGVCRKKSGGTMCPSYMATLDERHSTRGRGNALRLAISGQFEHAARSNLVGAPGVSPPSAMLWSDPETIKTLDLCLACKACKAECPSNVDIARLKAEYTAQRYRATGRVPLAARAFGHVRTLNRLGAIAPGLANAFGRARPVRAILNRVLGLAPQRSLPAFARALTRDWPAWTDANTHDPGISLVAVFADCFTLYNEPAIGLAARHLLRAFGYEPVLVSAGCCGRALISTGLLADAIATIDETLARLAPLAARPNFRALLVLEPSCLSAIKDDWLSLKAKTPLATRQTIAARSFLVEDFLERFWDEHPRHPTPRASPDAGPRVLLHAHCHQKALWGSDSSAAILRRFVGPRLVTPDTGCCGMAGSFGYTRDRYDLSMRIGELSVFPAVRSTDPSAVILAPGTSCRHQIHDGTGRSSIHPVELIANLV